MDYLHMSLQTAATNDHNTGNVVVLQTAEACGQICGKLRDYIGGQKYMTGQMSHREQ
jgi:hypothetical protein